MSEKKDFYELSLKMHEAHRGKFATVLKVDLRTSDDLSTAYTPGVAEPCRRIAENPDDVYKYTPKGNFVAVVSDGSAVLGLGNIGAHASIPVMEGKAILFKEFAGVDAIPIALDTQDPQAIIATVKRIAPVFGGINLEDISAPRCFEIEQGLQDIGIPVFHDDQHGTAVVILAALINAAKVVGKPFTSLKVVIVGAGAAGIATAKLLSCLDQEADMCIAVKEVIVCDSKGTLTKGRPNLTPVKEDIALRTNPRNVCCSLTDAMKDADVMIGVSGPNIVSKEQVESMAEKPIVISMANPVPEIMPNVAREAGAAVIGTGRSDFPNQINNVLAFPGIFRGALDARAKKITNKMKIAAAHALAEYVKEPTADKVLPDPLDKGVAQAVAEAVKKAV